MGKGLGKGIARGQRPVNTILPLAIVANLALLAVFKYASPLIDGWNALAGALLLAADVAGQFEPVLAGGRRVRQVQRDVPVGLRHRVPAGQVGEHLPVPGPPRVHVLDGELHVGDLTETFEPVDEPARVVALPFG